MHEFITDGITCNGCIRSITNAVKAFDPKAEIAIDIKLQKVKIKSSHSEKELAHLLEDLGYPVVEKRSS